MVVFEIVIGCRHKIMPVQIEPTCTTPLDVGDEVSPHDDNNGHESPVIDTGNEEYVPPARWEDEVVPPPAKWNLSVRFAEVGVWKRIVVVVVVVE